MATQALPKDDLKKKKLNLSLIRSLKPLSELTPQQIASRKQVEKLKADRAAARLLKPVKPLSELTPQQRGSRKQGEKRKAERAAARPLSELTPQQRASKKQAQKRTATKDYSRIHWCWRLSATTEAGEGATEEARLQEGLWLEGQLIDHCECYTFQLEKGEEVSAANPQGYFHWQGYCQFLNKKPKSWILKHVAEFNYLAPSGGTPKQGWTYGSKESTRIYGPIQQGEPEGVKSSKKEAVYKEAMAAPTLKAAMDIIKENSARDYCLYGEAIERNLKRARVEEFTHSFSLTQFVHPPLNLDKPVLLWGPTDTGKTSFALAHFKNPLLVRHMDRLKQLTGDHDGVVFDDMSWKHCPIESIIHLLDYENQSDIHARYNTITLPKGIKRIFTHNSNNPFYELSATTHPDQVEAIERRYVAIHILKKLFVPRVIPVIPPPPVVVPVVVPVIVPVIVPDTPPQQPPMMIWSNLPEHIEEIRAPLPQKKKKNTKKKTPTTTGPGIRDFFEVMEEEDSQPFESYFPD